MTPKEQPRSRLCLPLQVGGVKQNHEPCSVITGTWSFISLFTIWKTLDPVVIVKDQSSHLVYLNNAQNNKPVKIWAHVVVENGRC